MKRGHGPWTMDHGLWNMDCGPWTTDHGPWMMDHRPWTMDHGLWTMDSSPSHWLGKAGGYPGMPAQATGWTGVGGYPGRPARRGQPGVNRPSPEKKKNGTITNSGFYTFLFFIF